jgi:hypothetical protein
MSYAYGTRGAPAVGGGLPGLPQRGDSGGKLQRSAYTRIVTPGSGVIEPPEGAKFMRAAVVGGGTIGNSFGDGGGAGCAATKIIPATSIQYTLTAAATSANPTGGTNTLVIPGYPTLIASGAPVPTSGSAPGGTASGGDYNYPGGAGGTTNYRSPGGAAGPGGPGGNGVSGGSAGGAYIGQIPDVVNQDWPIPGGQGGNVARSNATNSVLVVTTGAGAGALSRPVLAAQTLTAGNNVYAGAGPISFAPFGRTNCQLLSLANGGGGVNIESGGEFGGGAAQGASTAPIGGIVVEWFY